jgi:hypothetical protein
VHLLPPLGAVHPPMPHIDPTLSSLVTLAPTTGAAIARAKLIASIDSFLVSFSTSKQPHAAFSSGQSTMSRYSMAAKKPIHLGAQTVEHAMLYAMPDHVLRERVSGGGDWTVGEVVLAGLLEEAVLTEKRAWVGSRGIVVVDKNDPQYAAAAAQYSPQAWLASPVSPPSSPLLTVRGDAARRRRRRSRMLLGCEAVQEVEEEMEGEEQQVEGEGMLGAEGDALGESPGRTSEDTEGPPTPLAVEFTPVVMLPVPVPDPSKHHHHHHHHHHHPHHRRKPRKVVEPPLLDTVVTTTTTTTTPTPTTMVIASPVSPVMTKKERVAAAREWGYALSPEEEEGDEEEMSALLGSGGRKLRKARSGVTLSRSRSNGGDAGGSLHRARSAVDVMNGHGKRSRSKSDASSRSRKEVDMSPLMPIASVSPSVRKREPPPLPDGVHHHYHYHRHRSRSDASRGKKEGGGGKHYSQHQHAASEDVVHRSRSDGGRKGDVLVDAVHRSKSDSSARTREVGYEPLPVVDGGVVHRSRSDGAGRKREGYELLGVARSGSVSKPRLTVDPGYGGVSSLLASGIASRRTEEERQVLPLRKDDGVLSYYGVEEDAEGEGVGVGGEGEWEKAQALGLAAQRRRRGLSRVASRKE